MRTTTFIGTCANCGSEEIDYGALEIDGDYIYYPYYCNACESMGKEWYVLIYHQTESDDAD